MPEESDDIDIALREAHRAFDNNRESLIQQADHAVELIKINLLVFGALPVVVNFSDTTSDTSVIFVLIGAILSIVIEVSAYRSISTKTGLDRKGIEIVANIQRNKEYEGLINAYGDWSDEMNQLTTKIWKLMTLGIFFTIFSIGALLNIAIF